MTRWHPSLDLARLFEAMCEEILAESDDEFRQTCGLQGWEVANDAREVRAVIAAARGGADGDRDPELGFSEGLGDGRLTPGPASPLWCPSLAQRH